MEVHLSRICVASLGKFIGHQYFYWKSKDCAQIAVPSQPCSQDPLLQRGWCLVTAGASLLLLGNQEILDFSQNSSCWGPGYHKFRVPDSLQLFLEHSLALTSSFGCKAILKGNSSECYTGLPVRTGG